MMYYKKKALALILSFTLVISPLFSNIPVYAVEEASLTINTNTSYEVTETTELSELTIKQGATIDATTGYLVSLVVDGVEKAIKEGTYTGEVVLVLTKDYSEVAIGSYTGRGGEAFRTGLYVDEEGVNEERSVEEALVGGTYSDVLANKITIDAESENFNGIIVNGADYTISNAILNLKGNGDGLDEDGNTNVSDFSGLGSAVAAYNDATVILDHVEVYTDGVARPALFTDSGSDTLVTDSKLVSMGGPLYADYVNSADQAMMVVPPWVLGITGNARTTNLMGDYSTATFVRTDTYANQWGVLSSDSGINMVMVVVDCDLTLLGEDQTDDPYSTNYGSGYGTYIIGNAQESFYGCTFNVGTYASILTGGTGLYASSNFDTMDVYPLEMVDGEVVQAEEAVFEGITGLGQITTINSDAFGFMAHNAGTLTITDETVVNTDNATFLMKNGDVDMIVSDGAKLNVEDGVILQIMDNDDAVVGIDPDGIYMPTFNTDFYEKLGYPGMDYDVEVTTEGQNTYSFTATEVDLEGNLYNGSGYFNQAADLLEVTLGDGATLVGDISSTSVIHVDESGQQNTHFTIDEYYYLGHVANKAFYNGGNNISVSLEDGAIWTVEDISLINRLEIDKDSMVTVPEGKVLSVFVNQVKKEIEAGQEYHYEGEILLAVTDEEIPIFSEDNVVLGTLQYPNGLIIGKDTDILAPDGYAITLVVEGVERNIEEGIYMGNVTIAFTKEHSVPYMSAEHAFRMGLYVEDGQIIETKSVVEVLNNMVYSNTSISGGEIKVAGDNFNGIVIGGASTYRISDVTLFSTGNGGNDFAGYGASIMSADTANVTVEDAYISTDGVLGVAVFAGDDSTLTVKNSTIITGDETTNEGVEAPMMVEVPWILGISGNTRATNVLGSANVTYEDSYIEAQSWGALSTDSCKEGATLTVINTEVVVTDSGYGSYADGGVFNTYTNTTFDVPDYGLIVAAGKCGALFDGGTVVNSDRFGIMWHKNQEGTVTITDGTVFNTGETAFLIKSDTANTAYPNLVVDGAIVTTENGVILQLMESDDPGMNPNGGGPGSDTMWAKSYTVPEVIPVLDETNTSSATAEGTVDATFKNMDVNGDIYNTRWTAGQNLNVVFENAHVQGVISSATQAHKNLAAGELITPDNREELGEVTATPSETISNGMIVTLDSDSTWTVTATSYLSSLTLAEGGEINTLEGNKVTMTVNGVEMMIQPGDYSGNIVINVSSVLTESDWFKILEEKTSDPNLWVEFIEQNKEDPIGKWLMELIRKLAK